MFLIELLIVLLVICFFSMIRPKRFPPGPIWLPIVGNKWKVEKLAKRLGGLHLAVLELSKQYNTNVLGLKLGRELVVVVFSYPLIKSVLNSEVYCSRPNNFFTRLRCFGRIRGITCTDGEWYNVQKCFLLRNFRTLGFGKQATEQVIQDQASDIINDIAENAENKDINIGMLLAPAVISVLWSVIAGSPLNRKDPTLNKLLDLFERRAKLFDIAGGILAQTPWLRFISPEKTGYNLIKRLNKELKDFFMETITEHHLSWSEGSDSDVIYSFITEMKKEGSHYSFTDEQLLMLCLDLFIAGSKTTSGTLNFAFFMMLHHPDIQANVQRVLDESLVRGQSVSDADRLKVPYVEAVLLEVERYCTLAPIIGPRRALEDAVLEGYVIPKNSTVLLHTHGVNTSPLHWTNPEQFIPERFLTTDGNVIRHEQLMTFSLGKRRCIGESLAKNFMFIFFTEILRTYSIVGCPENKTVSAEGMLLSAEYTARFVKRTDNLDV